MTTGKQPEDMKRPFSDGIATTLKDKQLVPSYLTSSDLGFFSIACLQTKALTKEVRNKRALRALLQAVVYGDQEQAERILKLKPELLLQISTAIDYSGREIKDMPFKAALRAGDVEMCNMMKTYFAKLENGQTKMKAQFDAVFTDYDEKTSSLEDHINRQKKDAFNFTDIIQAISNATDEDLKAALGNNYDNDSKLNSALNEFRSTFEAISLSEKIFNPQHLLKAFKCYSDNFAAWGPGWDKHELFWCQVVGFSQRYLPACYAQAFAQGIYYITEEKEPLRRSFDFKYDGGFMFPLVVAEGLGFDHGVNVWQGGCGGRDSGPWHEADEGGFYKIYVEQKHQAWRDLHSSPDRECRVPVCNSLK